MDCAGLTCRIAAIAVIMLGGCGKPCAKTESAQKQDAPPITIAVAPAVNQSGSMDFDPERFGDLMASELARFEGVSVVPVSRVLSALSVENRRQVESPAHALEICDRLGADAILVFAVTEYDAYDPPSIGITGQLYGKWPGQSCPTLDAVAHSRRTSFASEERGAASVRGLLAQSQRVFDASGHEESAGIEAYGRQRDAEKSPFGWRKHMVSQQHFMRYCCHETIRALLSIGQNPEHVGGNPREERTP